MAKREIGIGCRVYDRADRRHFGVVLQVNRGGRDGARAKVRWEETGWLSCGLPLDDLRIAPREPCDCKGVAFLFKRAIAKRAR